MKKFILLLVLLVCLIGCAIEQRTTKTSLELQAIQSREFETNKKIAFASVLPSVSILVGHFTPDSLV